MKKKIVLFLVLAMILTLAAGCGSQKTIKTEDGKVSYGDGKATYEGKDGTKTEVNVAEDDKEVALPDGYPEDLVPVMAGSKVQVANKNEENGKISYVIMLNTSKSADEVNNYYKNVLKDAEDLSSTQINDIYSVIGVKNNQEISVSIMPDNGKTTVQIGIVPKQ